MRRSEGHCRGVAGDHRSDPATTVGPSPLDLLPFVARGPREDSGAGKRWTDPSPREWRSSGRGRNRDRRT